MIRYMPPPITTPKNQPYVFHQAGSRLVKLGKKVENTLPTAADVDAAARRRAGGPVPPGADGYL